MNIGIDIEDCERFSKTVSDKIFTNKEIDYIKSKNNSSCTIAGLYCAKEAYFKAKGTGIIKSQLLKVEILHDENGKPFYGNDANAILSISHTKSTAVAVCIIF